MIDQLSQLDVCVYFVQHVFDNMRALNHDYQKRQLIRKTYEVVSKQLKF